MVTSTHLLNKDLEKAETYVYRSWNVYNYNVNYNGLNTRWYHFIYLTSHKGLTNPLEGCKGNTQTQTIGSI